MAEFNEENILRWFRFVVTESAAATFTETEIQANLSLERGMIALIHKIEAEILPGSVDAPAAGATEQIVLQITRETKSAQVNFNDADIIAKINVQVARSAAIGTDAGPLYTNMTNPIELIYPVPMLFAGQSVFVGIVSTSTAAQTIRGRVGYSLKKVSERMYFRVANALLQ